MAAERDLEEQPKASGPSSRKKRPQRGTDTHVASALRSAYEETIREDIPDEFLDLLGKLA